MTDSPAVHAPLDPQEQPILEELLHVRDGLSLLKQDKSKYIKSQDVLALHDHVVEQVEKLNIIRRNEQKSLEQNRVDTVLDDCFQLISLFFLTIGRNDEAPAAYAESSTLKRLLDHLKEAGFYMYQDISNIGRRIDSMKASLERGKAKYSPHLITLLENRMTACERILEELQVFLATLAPSLHPTYEKLVEILRALAACNTRSHVSCRGVLDSAARLTNPYSSAKVKSRNYNMTSLKWNQT